VNTAPVQIEPRILEVDLSVYTESEIATIACPVITCAEQVTVTFLRGSEEVDMGTLDITQPMVYNLNLMVASDTSGTYACKVDTVNPTDTVIQEFNITGTPMPLPPPTQPPGSTTGPSGSDTSNGSPSGTGTRATAASTTDSSALGVAMAGSFSVLVSLLVLAIVH